MHFQDLQLIDPLLRAVHDAGYTEPTPIQAQAIPHVLTGTDLIGCAQTGTGKTAAFALPILQHLNKHPYRGKSRRPVRALILSPTRELASQIGETIATFSRHTSLRHTVIFGGVNQRPQVTTLKRGVDILVATPGRLLDLMRQGHLYLKHVEIFVLDEADRMLDMGFINDIRHVIKELPTERQTLLFSATMPNEIQQLAQQILKDPVMVEVTPPATTVEKIDQSVYFVSKKDKRALLIHMLQEDPSISRVLVFTRTKHGADQLVEKLGRAGINADAIHSNKSQNAREKALANFKKGRTRVLVATDIASRGIDVDDVTHVINFDLPDESESYVHRIGRTARAGAEGIAYSFCDINERKSLKNIEKLIKLRLPVVQEHPFAISVPQSMSTEHASSNGGTRRSHSGGKNRNNRSRGNQSASNGSSSTEYGQGQSKSAQRRRRRRLHEGRSSEERA